MPIIFQPQAGDSEWFTYSLYRAVLVCSLRPVCLKNYLVSEMDWFITGTQFTHWVVSTTATQSVEGRAREKSSHRLATFVRSQPPTEGPDGRGAVYSQGQAYSLKPKEWNQVISPWSRGDSLFSKCREWLHASVAGLGKHHIIWGF